MDEHSACGGWIGMMNDGSRAFETRLHTFGRGAGGRCVARAECAESTRMAKVTCQGTVAIYVAVIME